MNQSILINDLSENKMDKVIANEEVKAGWTITFCGGESWWFTITNGDNSSKTGFNCGDFNPEC